MNILKHIYIYIYIVEYIDEKYMVEHLKMFRVVLKLLEYIAVLHTLPSGRKLSYNFTKKYISPPPPRSLYNKHLLSKGPEKSKPVGRLNRGNTVIQGKLTNTDYCAT